jgi:signal transduction histidine kinase
MIIRNPAAIAAAAWRHQLYDVEVVLNRAVASLLLTVQTVRDALRLPYLVVTAADPVLAPVVAGRPVAGVDTLACVAHGRTIAGLAVGYRHHGERWRPEERSLLAETARRAAALVQLAVVLRDLESARNRVVAAGEEERRRLRRELHDGISSALSGISLQLDCLGDDIPAQNAIVLDRIRQRTAEVAAEVRQLVDELRPPALEALGLTDAVREHAHMWEHDGGLMVRITAGQLPPLPASTELAAYRIATEAVTNAGRHARARRCEVRLSADPPWLVIEVTDDGIGFTEPQAGVGLSAMRERAAETGGNLSLSSAPGQGTRVTARLPLEAI